MNLVILSPSVGEGSPGIRRTWMHLSGCSVRLALKAQTSLNILRP